VLQHEARAAPTHVGDCKRGIEDRRQSSDSGARAKIWDVVDDERIFADEPALSLL
jgi:hypothetical protein